MGAKHFITICNNPNSSDVKSNEIVIPVVAIECKTYIERNMLDSCAGTATRLKKALSYCMYIVASEYMKLEDAQPELTNIDEVFVLCKATNSDRLSRKRRDAAPHIVHSDLVIDLYNMVSRHINAIWWQPEDALDTGKIINRP